MWNEVATERCWLCGKPRKHQSEAAVRTELAEKTEAPPGAAQPARCPACDDEWGESDGVSCC